MILPAEPEFDTDTPQKFAEMYGKTKDLQAALYR